MTAPTLEAPRQPRLSHREVEVLLAWLACDSKERAAERLYLSPCTLNTYLTRVRAKYAEVGRPAPTKAALVARALQDGLVAIEDL